MLSNATSNSGGHAPVTLESLLDSPVLTPSPLSESPTASPHDPTSNVIAGAATVQLEDGHLQTRQLESASNTTTTTTTTTIQNRFSLHGPHKRTVLREFCIELLFVLRNQDVNGYFLSQPSNVNELKVTEPLGLVDIEKRLLTNQYRTLGHFKSDVSQLFVVALTLNSPTSHAYAEARRLLTLCSDWFASLPEQYVDALNVDYAPSTLPPLDVELTQEPVVKDTCLGVLNPDNRGMLSYSERIRSIGDEAGPIKSGSHLLPYGGYREDRRNKVVPYTYLDYGPFYSFAPHYDSGASHCTPESHQLVLGTTWLPARTKFLTSAQPPPPPASTNSPEVEMDDITKALNSDTVRAALSANDHSLVVSLAVAEMEQQSTFKLASELDEILPGPQVDDDCVYSMCLANTLTFGAIKKQEQHPRQASEDPIKREHTVLGDQEHVVDLDQCESDDASSSPTPPTSVDSFDAGQELAESASDLMSLYCTQYRRLGDLSQTATASAATLRPSTCETDVAHRLVGRFVRFVNHAKPRDFVHPYTVRKCMGMRPDSFPLSPDESEEEMASNVTLVDSGSI